MSAVGIVGGVALVLGLVALAVLGVRRELAEEAAAAEAAEEARRADAAAFAEWAEEHPYEAAELRAMQMGPKYDPSPVYRYTDPEPWQRLGQEPARCPTPGCGTIHGLTLMWVEAQEHRARFVCPVCGATWIDPAWATDDAIAWTTIRTPGERWETTAAEQVPPATWELMQRMKREANE